MQDGGSENAFSTALIDVATLRAVQRLLGIVRSHHKESIDGDISAFETFVCAILFFDRIKVCRGKDTYEIIRSIFGESRPEFFNELIVAHDDEIAAFCMERTGNDMIYLDKAGAHSDAIVGFLQSVDRQLAINWSDRSSGNTVLLGQIIGVSEEQIKRDPLIRMLRDCAYRDKDSKTIGVNVEDGYTVHNQLLQVARSLNWLLYRTVYYSAIARLNNYTAMLHPIRSLFSANGTLLKMGISDISVRKVLSVMSREGQAVVADIHNMIESDVTTIDLPFFAAWISERGQAPKYFIEEILRLRDAPNVYNLRMKLRDLMPAESGDIESRHDRLREQLKSIGRTISDISTTANDLREEYGVMTPQGIPLSRLTSVINWGAALTGHPIAVPDLGLRTGQKFKQAVDQIRRGFDRNPFKQVLRSAVDDVVVTSRLGALHERLTKAVRMQR